MSITHKTLPSKDFDMFLYIVRGAPWPEINEYTYTHEDESITVFKREE